MSLTCPNCRVRNPPGSKICRLCRTNLLDLPPARLPEPEPEPVRQKPVPVTRSIIPETLTLEAPFLRLQGLLGTIVMGLMLLPMMYYTLLQFQSLLLVLFFGWILSVLFVPQLVMLIRPKRLIVREGMFIAKGLRSISTPTGNVLQMAHDGMGIGILFRSLSEVTKSARADSKLRKSLQRTGFHLHCPGFTVKQAEQLRLVLGLPEQAPTPGLRQMRDYFDQVYDLTPFVAFTWLLIAMNVVIFGIMVLNGVHWLRPTNADLINWGADFGPLTTSGQPWRLLTGCFLHIGILHLFFNMWALFAVGPLMERLMGNVGFLIMYLASGLAGSILSVKWNPNVVSAGASGAIFGIFGAMLGFLVLHRHSMPVGLYRHLWKSGVAFMGFNFLFSWSLPMIDTAGHLGGALAGFFAGMILSQPLEKITLRSRSIRNLILFLFATAMISPAFFLKHATPSPEATARSTLLLMLEQETILVNQFNQLRERVNQQQEKPQRLVAYLDKELIPAYERMHDQIEALPSATIMEERRLMIRYLKAKVEALRQLADGVEQWDDELIQRANEKIRTVDGMIPRQ